MNHFLRFQISFLALMLLAIPALADVALVGSASGSDTENDAEFTFTITVPSGTELAVVGVTNRDARNASWVRFDGQSNMTFVINSISSPHSDMDERAQLFYFLNPPAGSQTVRVSLNGTTRHKAAGCLLFTGVNAAGLSTPTAKCDENTVASNPSPTLNFSGAEAPTGSMVVSVINNRGGNLAVVGHTERWNIETSHLLSVPSSRHGGGTQIGNSTSGATVGWTPSATWPTEANWGMVAMVVPAKYLGISNIAPDTLSVNDNDPVNTVIGTLTATDQDNKPPYTWSLVNNAGGRFALNASTTLSVGVRIADASLIDHGQNTSHTIRVGARNAENPTYFEKDITVNVVDTTPPAIGTVTASRTYARWGEFVTFSTTITDNTALAGTPTMTLDGAPLVFSNQTGNVFTWGWNVPLAAPDGAVSVNVTALDTTGNEEELLAEDLVIIDNTDPYISGLTVSKQYLKAGDIVEISVEVQDFYGVADFPSMTLAGIDGGIPVRNGGIFTWQVGITAAYPEGPADILVTAHDLAGNEAQGSGPAMVTIDHTPPSIAAFASTHLYAKLNDIVTLQASVLDNFGLGELPDMYLNGNLLNPPSVSGNTYYWQFQITPAILQGAAVIVVEATDQAGNTSSASPSSTILIIDYTQPNISQLNVTPSLAKGGTSLLITAQVIDNYGVSGMPVMNINGWPLSTPTKSGYIYTWNFVVPSTPPPVEGPAEITVFAVDLAGNTFNLLDTSKLTYDPNAPVFSAVTATPNLIRLGQTTVITANVYDISPLNGLPTLTVNGVSATYTGVTDMGNNNKVYSYSFTVAASTPEGNATLTFSARDILGNVRTTDYTDKLRIDKTAPVISNVSSSPSISRAGGTVSITFDAVDATGLNGRPTVTVNGATATYYSLFGNHYEYRFTVRTPALDPDGPATIFITCRDLVGNSGSVQHNDKLRIDNALPVISNLVVFPSYARDGDTVTIGFRASDESGISPTRPEVKINGIPATFVAEQANTYEYQYTVRQAYDDEGFAELYIRLADGIGNVLVSESTGLLLIDFTPPTGTLVINNNDLMTRSTDVVLGITADDGPEGSGVVNMCFSDDAVTWTAWEPVAATREWQLKGGQGYKTLYMRLSDLTGNISTLPISDTIVLKPNGLVVDREGSGDVKGLPGYAVVLEVTPRNVFGSIQSYEWFKDGQPVEGFGPVLAIENFEEQDMGSYVCRVADEIETAESLPFVVSISQETPVPAASWNGMALLLALISLAGMVLLHRKRGVLFLMVIGVGAAFSLSGVATAEVTVVYSARAEQPMDLSDEALTNLALEKGTIEIWTRRDDGTVRRQLARVGEPGVANPGFSSQHREEYASYLDKGYAPEIQKDGSSQINVPLSDEATLTYTEDNKSATGPTFTMKVTVNGQVVLSEKRFEEPADGRMRPTMLRVDYPGGALIQVFEFTDTPPTPLPPVLLRKVGTEDDEKSDTYPKSWVTKADGDTQTREVQFIVPPQGLGSLGFDSGWVPGGSGEEPGGFIIQVRIKAIAGYTYDAAVNGSFNLLPESILALGPAAGSWGFYFGAEFTMKAAFDLPTILGFEIPPFEVDIPYVPDFNMVTSDRDNFNSWLLDSESTVRDEGGRTNVVSVDLVSILITQGILPELPDWVPLPKIGAALDVGAIANGRMTCDNISLSDGTVFTTEGQQLPIYVPETGYQAIAEYNEDGELNLGVKFYPFVFVNWFSFGFSWPTDFEDPDNLLARLEWLPVAHTNFPFTNAEINFTGQPSTLPANDWFTQEFQPVIDTNNISYHQVRFTPNLSNNFYAACVGSATGYRTNPAGGIPVTLGDNEFTQVNLTDNKKIPLYGTYYDSFYIGSNGYITFGSGDTTSDPSLEHHFDRPRISGLFLDMHPGDGGTISYKQLPNRVVVTYQGVRLANIITPQTANFQIEMFFDGRIVITWLKQDTYIGIIGLSQGNGVPPEFQESRFVNYPGCLTEIAPEYGIRVNFSPPEVLPYEPRWRAGSGSWNQSGTYISVPLGENWVYFNYIPLYWEAPETALTITNTPDVFVALNPVWKRSTGTVTIHTQPEIAAWTLTNADGLVQTGTGPMVLNNVPTGMTTVEWQPLPTYTMPSPASQQAMLYPGANIEFSGVYPPIIGEGQATLIVRIEPPAVLTAGAQWKVNGGEWHNSGDSVTIPDGNSTIEFKEVVGWTRPASQTLFFNRNTTTELIKGYGRHKGTVWVDTDPNNAPWVMTDGDGVEYTGVGDRVLQNIPTGNNLTITWGAVSNYNMPATNPFTFSLAQSEVKRVVGAYIPIIGTGEGIVRVTLYPPAVVNAGAQWRLFGGEWRSSGGMAASPDGEQTLFFSDVPGWVKPADMTVNVVRDTTNDYYANYERLTGTVVVNVEPDTAYWTLTDADGGTYSNMGDVTLTNIPTGEVSILWGDLEGYAPPQPNPATYTLDAGATVNISGAYVEAILTADFTGFPLSGLPPLEVNFQDASQSTTKEIVEWRWYFGDGKTSSERNPTHVYRDPGTYTVTLSVITYDQMDVISKKQYITVSQGMPTVGLAGLAMASLLLGIGGAAGLRKRNK